MESYSARTAVNFSWSPSSAADDRSANSVCSLDVENDGSKSSYRRNGVERRQLKLKGAEDGD
eukprot:31495-Pelagococcus_subviridis.AAC.7